MGFLKFLCEVKCAELWSYFGIFLVFGSRLGLCLDNKEFQKTLPERIIWGVLGRPAELPCDVTPPIPSDTVKMVFWFKDNIGMPWYSLDARSGLSQASHLTMSGDLGNRLYFIMDENPSRARLKIENVSVNDQGLYRCRVDFVNSPTRNFQVNLMLIEQPSSPRVFDAEGREIKANSSAGPFLEGEELFLSCQVTGGKPRPSVTWWHGDSILDGVVDTSSKSFTTVNQLFLAQVSRDLKGARFECRATSSEVAGYIVTVIPLVVYLKPNKVKIVTPNELMSNRKPQNVKCETSGSYPPAKLTWLLDGKPIKQSVVTEEETDTFTASILSMQVTAEDDGKELVCKAVNTRFPGGTAQDSRNISVAYPPKVRVLLDPESSTPAKEGDDVKLKCEGKARPKPHSYRWYQDGHIVQFNSTSGVYPMDDVLVMKHVSRKSAGQYACSATNAEGETYSAPFSLYIQYTPRCKKGHEEIRVGLVSNEELRIQCQVDAVPEVTRFFWTYNTTRGVLRVQGGRVKNKGGISTLQFRPPDGEIRSLSCWAANELGRQETPCLFFVVPAATPEKPRSCIYGDISKEGNVKVICVPGRDGGLPQTFILEVKEVAVPTVGVQAPGATTLSDQGEVEPVLAYRVLGERPEFELRSLQPGREYLVSVYAENAKGRSPSQDVLPSIKVPAGEGESETGNLTVRIAQDSTKSIQNSTTNLTPIYVVLTSCAVILVVVIITAVSILACRKPTTQVVRRSKSTRGVKSRPEDFEGNSEAGFGEGFQRRSAQYRASMYGPPPEEVEMRISRMIDRPDLILSPRSLNNTVEEDEM